VEREGVVTQTLNLMMGLAMGLNLVALGSSRLPTLIRAMSVQGALLGVMPLLLEQDPDWRVWLIALATLSGKGVLIPGLLRRALRTAQINRELEPLVGFVPSMLLGAAFTIGAVTFAHAMPLLPEHADLLLPAGAMATVPTGILLLVGRTKAISQVCGFLILENGIYVFGLLLLRAMPHLVEAGVLLDVTVAVFVIGIIVDRIQRAFDSLDTRKLTALRA
jgi:hydrogenase-4 component E